MYVKRVVLERLRRFEHLDLKFERSDGTYNGWWVITGDNASGKTALLKAIAMAIVGPDAMRTLQPSYRGWIHHGEEETIVAVEIVAGPRDGFAKGRRYEQPFWSELKLLSTDGPETTLKVGSKYKGKGLGPTHGPWADNPSGWFASGYGPFRRLYGASPEAQRIMSGPGRVARFATMFREDATLGECELWLKELHHKSLEGHSRESKTLNQVLEILNDDFLRNGLRVEKVDSEGLWLRQPDQTVLPLADMSEGYRAALAMLVDLLRHLVEVHGHENLVQEISGRRVVPHSGVVLIDEIDAHLHPEWQRQIGFWFKEKLPEIQFIVTTHSPLILQAADTDGIFHLPPPGDGEVEHITGMEYVKIVRSRPNQIYLGPAFNMEHTLSPPVVKKREEFARLRAKEHAGQLSPEERRTMKQLSLFVESDDSDDEE